MICEALQGKDDISACVFAGLCMCFMVWCNEALGRFRFVQRHVKLEPQLCLKSFSPAALTCAGDCRSP